MSLTSSIPLLPLVLVVLGCIISPAATSAATPSPAEKLVVVGGDRDYPPGKAKGT